MSKRDDRFSSAEDASVDYAAVDLGGWNSTDTKEAPKKTSSKLAYERAASLLSRDFFGGGKRQEILDLVLYLISYTYPFIVISGVLGVGKTTFARQLMKLAPESNCKAVSLDGRALSASPRFSLDVARAIGVSDDWLSSLDEDQSFELEKVILEFAEQAAYKGEAIILCVDDADLLTLDRLETLLRWVGTSHEQQLKVILLGDFTASDLFDHEVVAERFAALGHWITLDPLDEKDSEHFLRFLLKTRGITDYVALTAMMELYKKTKGVPLGLVTEFDQLMDVGQKKTGQKKEVELGGLSRFHFLVGAVAIFLIGLAWVFDEQKQVDDDFGAPGAQIDAVSSRASLPSSDPFSAESVSSRLSQNVTAADLPVELSSPSAPKKPDMQGVTTADDIPSIVDEMPVEPVAGDIDQSAVGRVVVDSSLSSSAAMVESVADSSVAVITPAEVGGEAVLPLVDGVPGVSLSSRQIEDSPSVQKIKPASPVKPLKQENEKPVAAKKIAAPKAQNKEVANAASIGRSGWLASAPSSHFTLQVFAGRDKSAAVAFVKKHSSLGKVDFFKYMHLGQVWYAVVYGDFASREAAKAASVKLPSALRGKSPWVRSVGDIKKITVR